MSTPVHRCPSWICYFFIVCVLKVVVISSESSSLKEISISANNSSNILAENNEWGNKIPILCDTSEKDSEFQKELIKSALVAFQTSDTNGIRPVLFDFSQSSDKIGLMRDCAKSLISNKLKVVVSVLPSEDLQIFSDIYESEQIDGESTELHVYSPRSLLPQRKLSSVHIKSLQMSEEARALALLNRVKKVGVQTLIPVLDGDYQSQLELLKLYQKVSNQVKGSISIQFTKTIFLNDPVHSENFQMILKEFNGFHENHLTSLGYHSPSFEETLKGSELKPGVLLLATNASKIAMQIASEKNHLLLSWFSPNIMEFEEWAYNQTQTIRNSRNSQEADRMSDSEEAVHSKAGQQDNSSEGTNNMAINSFFGLYTVNFVGSKGWDNPVRRNMLRELATFTGPSPRILSAVLTYDAVALARDHLKNMLHLPKVGLSGLIEFNKKGFRKSGTYLGTSSVPKTSSSLVTLLQPSTWILEDVISVKQSSIGSHFEISDYDIATSSVLPKTELLKIANSTRNEVGCNENIMNVVTYDPFTQMPYHYFFNEENLPDTLVVPNHQGFGITFVCTHLPDKIQNRETGDDAVSTLSLACTPGMRMTQPITCFRSHLNKRQKRDTSVGKSREQGSAVPSVQYQYSLSGKDPWYSQNSKNQYYYQPAAGNRDYNIESATYGYYQTTRLDVPISEEPPTTPAPNGPKLPELRQILKATKPFVGSCIGSSTGCAICVLVLGRLPLGTAPSACTGPCFVGTFGSCGSLLGRVFAETTVICTELFKQGLIDADTFVADAEFGKYMLESSPETLQGYTLLATPLVNLMKSSSLVTKIVAVFALPWANHMKYLLGRSNETNIIGSIVHMTGYPICTLTGRIYFIFANLYTSCLTYIIFLSPLLTSLMTILLLLILVPNLSSSKVNKHSSKLQNFIVFCTVMSKIKQIANNGLAYLLKAIGRST